VNGDLQTQTVPHLTQLMGYFAIKVWKAEIKVNLKIKINSFANYNKALMPVLGYLFLRNIKTDVFQMSLIKRFNLKEISKKMRNIIKNKIY
jgi:hypothetical protein